jgi:hypothetical protein
MSVSVTPSPASSPEIPPEIPIVLDKLPDIPLHSDACPRRTRQQIDLILLAIEALELRGSEAILIVARELKLQNIIKNRVYLWQLRCTNPLRRFSQRRHLTLLEAKAMVTIVGYLAGRLTVVIRELLLAYQQLQQKDLSVDHHLRLADYLERFRAHFRARMNPRRSTVLVYSDDEKLNQLALGLLRQLLFCTGTSGTQRFWISLFDGEV